MKKKIIIISIISVLLVIIGAISYCVIRNKIPNIQVSEDSILENDLSIIEIDNYEENTENLIIEEEQNLDESNIEVEEQQTETSIQQQTTQQVKSSSKTTNKVETKKAETKSEVVKETSTTKDKTPTKVDIPSTIAVEPKQEIKVVKAPTRCTNNNNHGMNVGNSEKWFPSKNDAIAYYNSQVSYWGNLWETEKIDDATYYSKCPSGYEVWSCIYCSKWTINFYYR